MANVYAIVNNGNWSNPATWFGSISPTSADDVFSNGLTVNVDVTTTVLSLRNTSATGIVAGGTFNLNNGSDLTCTGVQGIFIGSTTSPVQFTGGSLTSATLEANLPAGTVPNITGYYTVLHNGIGTLNIIGNIVFSGGLAGVLSRGQVNSTSAGTVRITGAVSSTVSTSELTNHCITMTGGKLFINGDVSGGSSGARGQIISGGTSEIEITGNVNTTGAQNFTGGSSITVIGSITNTGTGPAIPVTTATVYVTGAITVSNTGVGVSSTTGVITVGGPITASISANAVTSTSALVKCSGLLVNTNNFQAVWSPKITIESTTTSITFQKIGGGNQIMYIGTANNADLPAVSDVRLGTTFGVSNEFTGTMAVQIPANVSQGALVDDNKVGTFLMTPDSFVQELGVSTIPVAVRLQNSATVITTGTQLASFNI